MDFLSAGRKKSGVCGEVAFSRLLAEVHLYIYACSLMQLEWNEASSNFFQPANWASFNFPWYINYLIVREFAILRGVSQGPLSCTPSQLHQPLDYRVLCIFLPCVFCDPTFDQLEP